MSTARTEPIPTGDHFRLGSIPAIGTGTDSFSPESRKDFLVLSRRHAIRIGLTAGALGVSGATGWTAQALSSRGTRSTAAAAAVPAG
ncbi:hypothetical protein GA0115259_107671, partial [Streptomyces sp. MnatMP-M17]